MTRNIRLLALIVLAAAVAGCSTTPKQRSPTVVDGVYVSTIERAADRVGTDVIWINPPRRARDVEDEGDRQGR